MVFNNYFMKLKVGDKAPDFTLYDGYGNKVSLSDFRGKKVVLYFYPKDDTPGCTKESCSFNENIEKFESNDVEIIGVSGGTQESHKNFSEKYDLSFPLLVDENNNVANIYGAYGEKSMYGKKFMGIKRTTFFIDDKGIIKNIYENVSVDGHVEEVLENVSQ